MTEEYLPSSGFLKALIDDDTPLTGPDAESNLRRLLALMRDELPANRDWATFLLAQQGLDSTDLRKALFAAAEDENDDVRAEAIVGLAKRDKAVALPLLRRELGREHVSVPLFEAAEIVADLSLVDDLRDFAMPSEDVLLDELAAKALTAFEAASNSAIRVRNGS
ncbi:MAG: HEAT repeat domain-containing protein [Sphingomicrobium sp.]